MTTQRNKRYLIGKSLGAGGFGITYLAMDLDTEQRCCVKEYFLDKHTTRSAVDHLTVAPYNNSESIENFTHYLHSFEKEIDRLRSLKGVPNVVQYIDDFYCNNTMYLVMEYLDGCTLREYVEKLPGKRMSEEESIDTILAILAALKGVHRKKMLHRDISPDNVFILKDHSFRLIDFGSAAADDNLDTASRFLKPGYTAPEVQAMEQEGFYTDLYSVGAIIYFLLTGQRPHAMGKALLLPDSARGVSGDLAYILQTATSPKPHDRYQSAADMIAALERCKSNLHTVKQSPQLGVRGVLIGVLLLLVVLLTVVIVWGVLGSSSKPDQPYGTTPPTQYLLTDTPAPSLGDAETATPAPYMGYALMRQDDFLYERAAASAPRMMAVEGDALVYIFSQSYADGMLWNHVECQADGVRGFIPDDKLQHISAADAQPYLDAIAMQQAMTDTPTAVPTATAAPTFTPTPTPTLKSTATPTVLPTQAPAVPYVYEQKMPSLVDDFKVKVTVLDGVVESIAIESDAATDKSFIDTCSEADFLGQFIGKSSVDGYDAVSGATLTSDAVATAVWNALAAAEGLPTATPVPTATPAPAPYLSTQFREEYLLVAGGEMSLALEFIHGETAVAVETDKEILSAQVDAHELKLTAHRSGLSRVICRFGEGGEKSFLVRVCAQPGVSFASGNHEDVLWLESGSGYELFSPLGLESKLNIALPVEMQGACHVGVTSPSDGCSMEAKGETITVTPLAEGVFTCAISVFETATSRELAVIPVTINASGHILIGDITSEYVLYPGMSAALSFVTSDNQPLVWEKTNNGIIGDVTMGEDALKTLSIAFVDDAIGLVVTAQTPGQAVFSVCGQSISVYVPELPVLTMNGEALATEKGVYMLTAPENSEMRLTLSGMDTRYPVRIESAASQSTAALDGEALLITTGCKTQNAEAFRLVSGDYLLAELALNVVSSDLQTVFDSSYAMLVGDQLKFDLEYAYDKTGEISVSSSSENITAAVKDGELTVRATRPGKATVTVDSKPFTVFAYPMAMKLMDNKAEVKKSGGVYQVTIKDTDKKALEISDWTDSLPEPGLTFVSGSGAAPELTAKNGQMVISGEKRGSGDNTYELSYMIDGVRKTVCTLRVITEFDYQLTGVGQTKITIDAKSNNNYIALQFRDGKAFDVTPQMIEGEEFAAVEYEDNGRLRIYGKKNGTAKISVQGYEIEVVVDKAEKLIGVETVNIMVVEGETAKVGLQFKNNIQFNIATSILSGAEYADVSYSDGKLLVSGKMPGSMQFKAEDYTLDVTVRSLAALKGIKTQAVEEKRGQYTLTMPEGLTETITRIDDETYPCEVVLVDAANRETTLKKDVRAQDGVLVRDLAPGAYTVYYRAEIAGKTVNVATIKTEIKKSEITTAFNAVYDGLLDADVVYTLPLSFSGKAFAADITSPEGLSVVQSEDYRQLQFRTLKPGTYQVQVEDKAFTVIVKENHTQITFAGQLLAPYEGSQYIAPDVTVEDAFELHVVGSEIASLSWDGGLDSFAWQYEQNGWSIPFSALWDGPAEIDVYKAVTVPVGMQCDRDQVLSARIELNVKPGWKLSRDVIQTLSDDQTQVITNVCQTLIKLNAFKGNADMWAQAVMSTDAQFAANRNIFWTAMESIKAQYPNAGFSDKAYFTREDYQLLMTLVPKATATVAPVRATEAPSAVDTKAVFRVVDGARSGDKLYLMDEDGIVITYDAAKSKLISVDKNVYGKGSTVEGNGEAALWTSENMFIADSSGDSALEDTLKYDSSSVRTMAVAKNSAVVVLGKDGYYMVSEDDRTLYNNRNDEKNEYGEGYAFYVDKDGKSRLIMSGSKPLGNIRMAAAGGSTIALAVENDGEWAIYLSTTERNTGLANLLGVQINNGRKFTRVNKRLDGDKLDPKQIAVNDDCLAILQQDGSVQILTRNKAYGFGRVNSFKRYTLSGESGIAKVKWIALQNETLMLAGSGNVICVHRGDENGALVIDTLRLPVSISHFVRMDDQAVLVIDENGAFCLVRNGSVGKEAVTLKNPNASTPLATVRLTAAPTVEPPPKPTAAPTAIPTATSPVTSTPTPTPTPVPEEKAAFAFPAEITAGETIKLGLYEQDNNKDNGKEPIEWIVLKNEGDRILLLSKYALDGRQYNSEKGKAVTWGKSDLAAWLNDSFYKAAFDENEKRIIYLSDVVAERNRVYDVSSGNNTKDHVFLLSMSETEQYCDEQARICRPTKYALAQGVQAAENNACWWWLRTSGENNKRAAYIYPEGKMANSGAELWRDSKGQGAVRPAMWIGPEEFVAPAQPVSGKCQVGDFVLYGKYEQDNNKNNGKEAIEWLVLEREGDKVLLLSRYALDSLRYHIKEKPITWKDCSLRNWLNETFLKTAFSKNEIQAICKETVTAEDNQYYRSDAGEDVQNYLFLLSLSEAQKYFANDEERLCRSTRYALKQGASTEDTGKCNWWLRTPGDKKSYAVYVNVGGKIILRGINARRSDFGIRPAMWLDLSKLAGYKADTAAKAARPAGAKDTEKPAERPAATPTRKVSATTTPCPTEMPTATPTLRPTDIPTARLTAEPTECVTDEPSPTEPWYTDVPTATPPYRSSPTPDPTPENTVTPGNSEPTPEDAEQPEDIEHDTDENPAEGSGEGYDS